MMYSMCLCFGDIVQDIQVQEYFTFNEEPKAILDREIRQLRIKQVPR